MPTLLQVLNGEPPAKTRPVRVQMPPGTHFRYSESHFALLQQLLIDVTRTSFPDLMRTLVFEPLGMRDSSYNPPFPERRFGATASGHYFDGVPVHGKWRLFPALAASGLWTTPCDLARLVIDIQLARAGKPSKVLGKEIVDQLLSPQTPPGGRASGLGFELKGEGEAARFRHSGDNIGFKCFVQGFCERGMGAVLMSNGDSGEAVHRELFQIIAKEYGWATSSASGVHSRPTWRDLPYRLAVGGCGAMCESCTSDLDRRNEGAIERVEDLMRDLITPNAHPPASRLPRSSSRCAWGALQCSGSGR